MPEPLSCTSQQTTSSITSSSSSNNNGKQSSQPIKIGHSNEKRPYILAPKGKLYKFLNSGQFIVSGREKKIEKLDCIKTSGKHFDSVKTSRELILLICMLFLVLHYFSVFFSPNFFVLFLTALLLSNDQAGYSWLDEKPV